MTSSSFEQPKNAMHSIDLTDDGIEIWVSDEHPLKVHRLISAIVEGIMISSSDEHRSKHDSPSQVIDEGIFMFVNFEQFLNESGPITISGCDNKRLIISILFFSAARYNAFMFI